MEEMSGCQEAAYELLYRWLQRECRLLSADAPDPNPLLCQGFRVLLYTNWGLKGYECDPLEAMQERPALFKYSLDELSTARRNSLVRAFIDALTRGGIQGPAFS